MAEHDPAPVWTPSDARLDAAQMTAFRRLVAADRPSVVDRASLYAYSVEEPGDFWGRIWNFCGVVASEAASTPVQKVDAMPGATWFPGARLNFAENLLRYGDDRTALVAWNQDGRRSRTSYRELRLAVARLARTLRQWGVGEGDRVAAFMPNLPETVVAMLAASSIGAVFSSCSPDFGVNGVLDRFGQIEPKVLFTADGYSFAEKTLDSLGKVEAIVAQVPSVERVVVVPYVSSAPDLSALPTAELWPEVLRAAGDSPEIDFAQLPFDHPLYIMYSSGTTGLPKCMVHSAGGTLLQHLKELVLHTDLRREDTIFYFTTCGWMMWNWLVSSLAVGSAVVLYDGSPMKPEPSILWRMAAEERVTVFGTSAKYLALIEKEGLRPGHEQDLSALRAVLSTGSPLLPESYDYVYREIAPDVQLASISGGTDLISCFALGDPTAPVFRGELQTRGLGMKVEIFDDEGQPLVGEPGELVCTGAFPSMPVGFWNDPDGSRYHAAYFDVFDNVWRHGDWAEVTPRGGLVIYGRSDATLNPGGVRIGTAEIYRQVEQIDEVVEALVVGQRHAGDVRIVLFMVLRRGVELDDALRDRIRRRIRSHASPHHVPRKILSVDDLPRTRSGKITELAVRDILHGRPVKNVAALANPEALDQFRDRPELQT
ncbi:MAG: acetoacetate--CoA ligase [Acidobacteriota bacterium]